MACCPAADVALASGLGAGGGRVWWRWPGVGCVGGHARCPIHGLRALAAWLPAVLFARPVVARRMRLQANAPAVRMALMVGRSGHCSPWRCCWRRQGAHAGALAGLAGWFVMTIKAAWVALVADVGKAPRSTTGLTLEQLVTYGC